MISLATVRASLCAALFTFMALPLPASAADFGSYDVAPGTSYFSASDRRPLDGSYRNGTGPADWNGLYFGAHAGWGIGESSASGAFDRTTDADGFSGGLHAGYNFQSGALMTGLEADGDWSGTDGTASLAGGAQTRASVDWLSSLRLRLGMTNGNWLLYGTAGVALAGLDMAVTGPGSDSLSSETLTGYAAGVGAELALTQTISARIEALHFGFSEETLQTSRGAIDADLDVTTIRGGLSIKLN